VTEASGLIQLTAITVTYIPYMAAELPSNLMLKKIGPKIQLPIMMLLWGLVSTCQSQVKSYSSLLAYRFFIGLFEGGLFPSIDHMSFRFVLVCFSALQPFRAPSLVCWQLPSSLMEGLRGMHGWQV
jgi:hypothetical protein